MNDFENSLQASTRFISSEMQDLLDQVAFLIPNWKWLSLIAGFITLYFVRFLILGILKKIKNAQSYFHEKSFMQFFFKLDIERGLSWSLTALIATTFVNSLGLTSNLESSLELLFKVILSGNLIRVSYLAVDAFGSKIQEWAKTTESQIDDQLAPLATKTLKVLVVITGILIVLQNLGVNVTALLAGLGIGGVALAFAAQDTVANVFGTITILLDTPFKLGDRIKLGDTEGIVEEVGFRSTRIRTFYNSLVTLPNSVVAKEKIDNLTDRRNWIRFRIILGLTYDAGAKQIKDFCSDLMASLAKDSSIDPQRVVVHLDNFADSSINVVINFHYKLDVGQTDAARNEVYLELIRKHVEDLGLDFAFPTRTMIIQSKTESILNASPLKI